jgi:IclR family transcriptional regulator, acetate operon repressor
MPKQNTPEIKEMPSRSRNSTPVGQPSGSVENALRTLQLLRDRHLIQAGEVASELGVARSTAHRLLTLLSSYGVVEQEAQGPKYRPGPLLAQLGLATLQQHDIVEIVHPYMERLSDAVNETVHLMVLHGTDSVFVDSVECRRQALRVSARTGLSYPAYATSGGKALLARLDDDAVRAIFSAETFSPATERTIGSVDGLLRELEEVRANGYATNWGESETGIAAVAIVQLTASGSVAGALCISAPEQRLPPSRLSSLIRSLNEVAREVASMLP